MPNSPEARTETGEIKDVQTPPVVDAAPPVEPPKPAAEAPVIPETYEFKAPEGYEISPELIAEATPLLKELNLTQEQANKLMDFYNANSLKAMKGAEEFVTKTREGWVQEIMNDRELGPRIDEVKSEIGKALNSLGNPELVTKFKDAMNLTGAGDHPAFVKAFYAMAKNLNEGRHVPGGQPSPAGQTPSGNIAPPTIAKSMYPNLPSTQR
jgi:hypothetical protein